MAPPRPRFSDRRLGLVAPVSLVVVLAVILLLVLLARRPEPKPQPPPPSPPPSTRIAPEAPDTPLDRRAFLHAAADIAAAYAAGVAASPSEPPLAARAFVMRIPFGCEGPQTGPGGAQAFYELDTAKRTVRLVARPAAWTELPVIRESAGAEGLDAVEGFWVRRPWTGAGACPPSRPRPVPAAPTAPATETVGLAQLFTAEASRVGQRRARPYEFVRKLGPDDPPPGAAGFRLVLEGRMAAFPDGRVAHCWSESADHRPVCLFAVTLDRVAFEDGAEGRLITEWRD